MLVCPDPKGGVVLRIGLQQAQPHRPIDLPVEVGEAGIGGGYMVVDPLVEVEGKSLDRTWSVSPASV